MRTKLTSPLLTISAGLALLAFAGSASAQVDAYDDASGYTKFAGDAGWYFGTPDNTNGGFGFTPWVFTKQGSDYQGFYIGNGTDINTNGNAWGIYANNGNDALRSGHRRQCGRRLPRLQQLAPSQRGVHHPMEQPRNWQLLCQSGRVQSAQWQCQCLHGRYRNRFPV